MQILFSDHRPPRSRATFHSHSPYLHMHNRILPQPRSHPRPRTAADGGPNLDANSIARIRSFPAKREDARRICSPYSAKSATGRIQLRVETDTSLSCPSSGRLGLMNALKCLSRLSLHNNFATCASPARYPHALPTAVRFASSISAPVSPSPSTHTTEVPKNAEKTLHQKLVKLLPLWSTSRTVRARLRSFGISKDDLDPLLKLFSEEMRDGSAWNPISTDDAQVERLWHALAADKTMASTDRTLNQLLYSWVADNASDPALAKVVGIESLSRIVNVAKELDYRRLPERFPEARRIRRKVIMHVGPTNSGKTHNALRALAAARSGQYMGPLRLLAFEIYSRLNSGQIIPLGADPASDPHPELDTQTGFDATLPLENGKPAAPAIRTLGDARYARKCNLVTGEERREVAGAKLFACTVEMCDMRTLRDIAIIDEIQMIADPDRGAAWTCAVLGVPAREVHLCGEETAVPVVEALLRETGDELVVNRYERLSPLRVADEALGDLSKVQKGDCVVAFSRSRIFAAKQEIERRTKLRCAVAYGRLPPEVRSEQAALFNDPNSGFDVLVGSDALGMGLNLKIRRVIFTQVSKYNGISSGDEQLTTSQIKQIGGRAGRFGLHGDKDASVGIVTTLKEEDLPVVKAAFDAPISTLPSAYVDLTEGAFGRLIRALPEGVSAVDARDTLTFCARLPPHIEATVLGMKTRTKLADADAIVSGLAISDRETALDIPYPALDEDTTTVILELLREFAENGRTDITRATATAGLLQALNDAAKAQQEGGAVARPTETLTRLETLHKVLVAYAWAYWKWPSAFYAHNTVVQLLRSGEGCMDYILRSWAKHATSPRKRRDGGRGFSKTTML
ncbi:unnamed protein product [Peniophora sp. CBMAI 1063]|nr:unnamed protein product [Peniophora sp. CBMAI 1063]